MSVSAQVGFATVQAGFATVSGLGWCPGRLCHGVSGLGGAQAGFAMVIAAWVGAQAAFVPRVRVRVRDRVSFSVSSSCRPEKAQFHTVE